MAKRTVLAGGAAAIMGIALTVMPAQAGPVTSWSFTVNAGFSSYTSTGGGHSGITAGPNNVALGVPSSLSWGTGGSGPSNLDLGGTNGMFTGVLTTNAAAINTTTVIANNRPITGNTLEFASILDTLQLTPLVPPSGGFLLPALTFNIDYDETPNTPPCAAPSGSNPCADILAISNLTNAGFNTTDPTHVFISQPLAYNGENYKINLFITGLVSLNAAECNAVNAADGTSLPSPGCIGFISQENNSNQFQASLQILDQGPIVLPEPGTIVLFGAGLFGLGGLARRRRKTTTA
jgi:hypothetical protein